jgi:hypothetical protein
MTSNEEWSRINRDLAELAARYDSIKQMWEASDIPTDVMKTPDWQSGWRVLLGWIERHWPERWDPAFSPLTRDARPFASAWWANEVHIFSHWLLPGGHTPRHADLEEEATRLILQWWNERLGK